MAKRPALIRRMAALLAQDPGAAPIMEQRQRGGRIYTIWPKGLRFDPDQHFVAPLPLGVAKRFVKEHHYSSSYLGTSARIGLFLDRPGRSPQLVGVAAFGLGPGSGTLKKYLGKLRGIELTRLVLLDEVGFYGETWFLKRAFEMIRQSSLSGERLEHHPGAEYLITQPLEGVLAFSDPVPRTTLKGKLVMPGHIGHIYQTHGGIYTGRTGATTNILLPDGTVITAREQTKIAGQESGASQVYQRLLDAGARPKKRGEGWLQWLQDIRTRHPLRRLSHPGTHGFVWKLSGKRKRLRDVDYPAGRSRPGTMREAKAAGSPHRPTGGAGALSARPATSVATRVDRGPSGETHGDAHGQRRECARLSHSSRRNEGPQRSQESSQATWRPPVRRSHRKAQELQGKTGQGCR